MIMASMVAAAEHDTGRSVLRYTRPEGEEEGYWRRLAPTQISRDRCHLVVSAGALFATGAHVPPA